MTVNQIATLMNSVTQEVLGKTDIVKEDLSNVIDIGNEVFGATAVDNYVKALVNRIGRTIFVNRPYAGKVPSVLMDGWEYGSVLQKIQADIPEATINDTWQLEDKKSYDPNIFYKPNVSAKFFNSKVTFEVPLSFTELQVKQSFNSAEELNAFLSMLYNSVEKSMTVKIDALIMRTINNFSAHIFSATATPRSVNLLTGYNTMSGETLTADKAITSPAFLRYASMQIALYADRLATMSSLFNAGGKARFTPRDSLKIVMLSDFAQGAAVYLESDTFHNELVKLPSAETVPYWQASGQAFDFASISQVQVATQGESASKDVTINGLLAVMFDRDALGVANLDRRVTTNYNPKAEFFNNWYKFDAGYFNDLNENFVLFYVANA